jgi:3-deoxy-7-phosphoheptulonate synthase
MTLALPATIADHESALPQWPDDDRMEPVLAELRERPPLVEYDRCRALTDDLARVADGRGFVVHAGDCAELFADVSPGLSARKDAQLRDLSWILRHATGRPVVRLGRIAGQFAKPRSCALEDHDGRPLPVYRGDAVNDRARDPLARHADCGRLLTAYDKAADVLRHLRARRRPSSLYSSHDALLCEFEEALIRIDPHTRARYASSAHLLWAGDRTRRPGGPHIELLASVANPVAIKLGPGATADDVAELIEVLDPDRQPGRLVFIARLGIDAIDRRLPELVEAARAVEARAVWLCDPMHQNTFRTAHGRKTRAVSDLVSEVAAFVRILRRAGVHPGGLHLEATPEPVTECIERREDAVSPTDLPRYRSGCDPRLNARQARRVVASFATAMNA